MIAFNPKEHTYDVDGVRYPNVTGVLKAAGLIDDQWFTEWNRKLGSCVHEATALYDKGVLDASTLDPVLDPYMEAWQAFRLDSGFIPMLIEEPVANIVHQYAGTLDRFGSIKGNPWLIDIKTGQTQRWAALQTAAYAGCLDAAWMNRAAVELQSDGRYNLREHKDRTDWDVWIGVLNMIKWKRRTR